MVAARNEERTIESCLNSLISQNFDFSRLEILVGDDQSEDQTAEIVMSKAVRYPIIRFIEIPPSKTDVRGKAHVLAHLARQATGDVFLITDADTRPNREWVQTLVTELQLRHIAMVNGVTDIPLHKSQDMEWLYAQGLLKVLSDFVRPVTCIGNNMAITRVAYEATGGYENIPFSLTEDHALFEEAYARGYHLKQLFSDTARAATQPVRGFLPFLRQRKRWMTGAVKLPLPVALLLALQSLFLVFIIVLGYFDLLTAIYFFLARVIIRMGVFHKIYHAVDRSLNLFHVWWFEVVSGIMNILILVFYLLPGKIYWKKRRYN